MTNKFGIPKNKLHKIRASDKKCIYCHKEMIFPFYVNRRQDSATIEHLNFDGPFNWNDGLQIEDIVICCGSCNSSRGIKNCMIGLKLNIVLKGILMKILFPIRLKNI